MSLVSVLGCGTWFFPIEEQLYCVRTHVQDARRVANPTGIHRHVDDLLFDFRRLPRVAILQQERTPRTAFFSAPVPLLALPGLAMAHNVGPVTVRTVQDLENHEATRSC